MELPLYFIVGDRPVQVVPTLAGGMDVFAYDWQTGGFVRDLSYLSKCLSAIPSEEAEEVSENGFHGRVLALRQQLDQPPVTSDWRSALQAVMAQLASPDFAEWGPLDLGEALLAPWDDPRHAAGTAIRMWGGLGSYLVCHATLLWQRAVLHLTVWDAKTEAGNRSEDVTLPPRWLSMLQSHPWPVTDERPLF